MTVQVISELVPEADLLTMEYFTDSGLDVISLWVCGLAVPHVQEHLFSTSLKALPSVRASSADWLTFVVYLT